MGSEAAPQPGGQDPTSADGGTREHPQYGRELWPGVYQQEDIRTIQLSREGGEYEIIKFTNITVEGENGATYQVHQREVGFSPQPDALEVKWASGVEDYRAQELRRPSGGSPFTTLEGGSGAKDVWDFIRMNPGKNPAELGGLIRELGEAAFQAEEQRREIRKRFGAA